MHRIAFLILIAALAEFPSAAQMTCSLANTVGTYAFYNEGVMLPTTDGVTLSAPYAEIGILTIDADGNVTGWVTAATPSVYDFELSGGTIQISQNCLGVFKTKLVEKASGATMPFEINAPLVVQNSTPMEIHSVVKEGPMGPTVPTIARATWVRISQSNVVPACSINQLTGTYVVDGRGVVYTSPTMAIPATWTMIGPLNSEGQWTGGGPMTLPMTLPPFVMGDSEVVINADCTGSFWFTFKNPVTGATMPGKGAEKLLIIRDGENITVKGLYVQGALGIPVVLETWTRITRQPMQ